jgi:hypothetical protein
MTPDIDSPDPVVFKPTTRKGMEYDLKRAKKTGYNHLFIPTELAPACTLRLSEKRPSSIA